MPVQIKLTLFAVLLVISSSAIAQERLGLRISNYSGINGVTVNPSSFVGSPLRWDVNVISMGAFMENNYAYFRDANAIKVLRNTSNIVLATELDPEAATNPDDIILDFATGNARKFANVDVFVMGPSAAFRVKQHHFGVFFGSRLVVSGQRVPSVLGYYSLDALNVGDQFQVGKFKMGGAAWSEVGINYGRNVFYSKDHEVNVGGTVKILLGHDGFFFNNNEQTTLTLQDGFTTYDHANITFGVANNLEGYGSQSNGYDFQINGMGAAIDLGATYKLSNNKNLKGYTWKFGVSLVDFGKINFKKNTQQHLIDTEDPFDFVQGQYAGIESFNQVYAILSDQSLSNQLASFQTDKFSIWMPAGIILTAERAITDNIYANATFVRRVRFNGAAIERTNIWSVTPRFEHRWFEASLPLVLLNDRDFRMGLALRLGPLVIGTDDLTSMFGSHDVTGTDIYMALKINPFSINPNKEIGNKAGKNKSGNPNNCFYF